MGGMSDPAAPAPAVAAAAAVAAELGAAAGDLEVLRVGAAVLFVLRDHGVVLRVERGERGASARRQVAVAGALAAADVPALRLTALADQPRVAADHWVTAWELLDVRDHAAVDAADLGRLTRRLHDRTRDLGDALDDLPRLDPFAAVEAQLAAAEARDGEGDADVRRLHSEASDLRLAWDELGPDPLGRAVVHGDLHRDNVVVTPGGLVLVDLELAGVGPPTYDLATQVAAIERYGGPPRDHEAFVGAYGYDVRDWAGCEVRTRTYLLWTTAWAVAHRHLSPRHEREAALRVAWWRDPTAAAPWTLH